MTMIDCNFFVKDNSCEGVNNMVFRQSAEFIVNGAHICLHRHLLLTESISM